MTETPHTLNWMKGPIVALLIGVGAGRAQSPSLPSVPGMQAFYNAWPALETGFDQQDTNQVAAALLQLVPLHEDLTDALHQAVARTQAAGLNIAFPGAPLDDLLALSRYQVRGRLARFDALAAASDWLSFQGTNSIDESLARQLDAASADTDLAARLEPALQRLVGETVPADLFLSVRADLEYRPGDVAGVRVEVSNIGDRTAEDVHLTFQETTVGPRSKVEIVLGDLEGTNTVSHIFFADIPDHRESVGLLVGASSDTAESVSTYEIILVNTNAP